MAKTRAQRKAERRKEEARRAREGTPPVADSEAQHSTQVPESADVAEAELAERGADLEELKRATPAEADAAPAYVEPTAPKPSRREARKQKRLEERERQRRARESEARRQPREAPVERRRGRVSGFIASCWAELRRVQWPDRETLIQASGVTLLFIAVVGGYLGALDAVFNWVVQRIL